MTILISGCGISSLVLAQGLRASTPAIPFRIFERDAAPSSRSQGYRIRLSAEAGEAIKSVVSTEVWELFLKSCALSDKPFGVRLKEDGQEIGGMPTAGTPGGGAPPGGPGRGPPPQRGPFYTMDRSVLRRILLTGLESHVSWSSEVTSYSASATSDDVSLQLRDGTTISGGQLVVGADSFRSSVRKQLFPSHKTLDTGVRAIYGKTPLSEVAFTDAFEKKALEGMTLVKDEVKGLTVLLEAIKFPQPASPLPPTFEFPEDYVYWVLITPNPSISPVFADHPPSSTSLHSHVVDLTSHWSPSLRPLFAYSPPDSLNQIKVLSALPSSFTPSDSWTFNPRVTLMGDSIHLMSPTGAQGAVTAIVDASNLVRTIRKSWNEGKGLGGVEWETELRSYEEDLRKRGEAAIQASFAGGKNMLGMKPMEECSEVEM